MADFERVRRVNEVLRREISGYLEKYVTADLKCLATVTRVKVAPDFHDAVVFISFLGGTEGLHKNSLKKILRHRNKIQSQINRNMKIRCTPKLDIRIDDSIAQGAEILRKMDELGL